MIATAIVRNPSLLIADEPTTALDATVQKQILDLLAERRKAGHTLLLISHDTAVVSRLADRVLVMNEGRIVEEGATQELLNRPKHPYTRQLLDAVPSAGSKGYRLSATVSPPVDGKERRLRTVPLPPRTVHPGKHVLSVHNLVKHYGGPENAPVVNDVSFDLSAGKHSVSSVSPALEKPQWPKWSSDWLNPKMARFSSG